MMKCCIMAMLQQKFEAVFPEEIYFDGLKTPGRKASGGDIRMSFAPSGDPSLDAAFFGGCGLGRRVDGRAWPRGGLPTSGRAAFIL